MLPLETSSDPKFATKKEPTDRTAEILWRLMLAMRVVLPGAMIFLFCKAYFGW
jgi:hypothetical protein